MGLETGRICLSLVNAFGEDGPGRKMTLMWAFARRIVAAAMLAGACIQASGCDDTGCTGAGCHDGVEVWFAAPLDSSSELSVSIEADQEQVVCDYAHSKGLDTCASSGVWIQGSGSQIDGFLLPNRHPEQLTLTFSSAGSVLVTTTVSPTYVTQQPNGSDCPPTCKNAKVQL